MTKSPLAFTLLVIFALLGGTASHRVTLTRRPSCDELKAAFDASCDDENTAELLSASQLSSCDEAKRELCDSKGTCITIRGYYC